VPGRRRRRAKRVAAMLIGRAQTEIPGPAPPAAPVPGYRFVRHAGQVFAWLLLAVLPAAVTCVLLG